MGAMQHGMEYVKAAQEAQQTCVHVQSCSIDRRAIMCEIAMRLWEELGADGWSIVALIISTSIMYWALTLTFVVFGRRIKTATSSYIVAIGVLVGAISARAALGLRPTALTGLIALATLIFWMSVFRRIAPLHLMRRMTRTKRRNPVVVMVHGEPLPHVLAQYRLHPTQLYSRLRQAGIQQRSDVAALIYEPTGSFTIIRQGALLDKTLFLDVVGIDALPAELFGESPSVDKGV